MIGTVFSDDCKYRYTLERELAPGGTDTCLFVMLNPSTADAKLDDPTIRRCIGFARGWGYSRLLVGNLFGLRATNPRKLLAADDPVGPENDNWLWESFRQADLVVAAWGAHKMAAKRAAQLRIDLMPPFLTCLGTTKDGSPRHPLYLKGDLRPVEFTVPV